MSVLPDAQGFNLDLQMRGLDNGLSAIVYSSLIHYLLDTGDVTQL
jgi:hypothetical protein